MAQQMTHFKDQRVGVFVDVQNMYYSAKNLYNAKVNFAQILKAAVGNRSIIRAIAYVIKADVKEEQNFFDALEKIGFEVKAKDLQVFAGGAKKGDWDIGLAMDTIELAPKLDTIIIVSGDGGAFSASFKARAWLQDRNHCIWKVQLIKINGGMRLIY